MKADIADIKADIVNMKTDISDNAADVSTHAGDISDNAADVSTNAGDILTNAAGVSTNAAAASTNAGDISTNAADVLTNAGDISDNADGISTNVQATSANAAAASTNAGDISNNADGLTTASTHRNTIITDRDQSDLTLQNNIDNIALTPGQKGQTGAKGIKGTHEVGQKGQTGAKGTHEVGQKGQKGVAGVTPTSYPTALPTAAPVFAYPNPTSCKQHFENGIQTDGVQAITVGGSTYNVFCRMEGPEGGGWTFVSGLGENRGVGQHQNTLQTKTTSNYCYKKPTAKCYMTDSIPVDLWNTVLGGQAFDILNEDTFTTGYDNSGIHYRFNNIPSVSSAPWTGTGSSNKCASNAILELKSDLLIANNYPDSCTNWNYQFNAYGMLQNKGNGHVHTSNVKGFAYGLWGGYNMNTQFQLQSATGTAHMAQGNAGNPVAGIGDLGIFIREQA
jgi:hypothetical protein